MMAQATRFLGPHSNEVDEFIKRFGLDPNMVRRVVLDIDVDKPVTAYVEMYASRGSLEIITNAELAPEIKVIE